MDKKRILKVIEEDCNQGNDKMIEQETKSEARSKIEHPHQTNPIYKNLANFHNEKPKGKWSIKDLLR